MKDDPVRQAPLAMNAATFRALGHRLVDQLAESLDGGAAWTGDSRRIAVRGARGARSVGAASRIRNGCGAAAGTDRTVALRAFAVQCPPAFLRLYHGVGSPDRDTQGDCLASAVKPNVGGWLLSPAATKWNLETVRWIKKFIGYPADCGGLLVSGGNMAKPGVALLAARAAKAGCGCSRTKYRQRRRADAIAHVRVGQKCAPRMPEGREDTVGGMGTDSIRWVPTVQQAPDGCDGAAPAARSGRRCGRCAVHGGRERPGSVGAGAVDRLGVRSTPAVPGVWSLVQRGRRVRRVCGLASRRDVRSPACL